MGSEVIAIDGPAASGKSSVAKLVARNLGRIYVNTGNMFRMITWAVLQDGINSQDASLVAALEPSIKLEFRVVDGHVEAAINGRVLSDAELNSPQVNAAVSHIAQVPAVRARLVNEQRALVKHGALVMEGRDIGSVIFPETPHKFYIDASEEVRAKRRSSQGLSDAVGLRDKLDTTRKNAPLVVPEGALRIDSSDMTLDEVVARVLAVLQDQGLAR
ncbi:MAG: cmk: cytidylate kinase [Verrucomicrobiaceae bacterium]|nr:cmk: cytidylate kinase [Verrucomicrobiaceae bacterium]